MPWSRGIFSRFIVRCKDGIDDVYLRDDGKWTPISDLAFRFDSRKSARDAGERSRLSNTTPVVEPVND